MSVNTNRGFFGGCGWLCCTCCSSFRLHAETEIIRVSLLTSSSRAVLAQAFRAVSTGLPAQTAASNEFSPNWQCVIGLACRLAATLFSAFERSDSFVYKRRIRISRRQHNTQKEFRVYGQQSLPKGAVRVNRSIILKSMLLERSILLLPTNRCSEHELWMTYKGMEAHRRLQSPQETRNACGSKKYFMPKTRNSQWTKSSVFFSP